MKERASWKRRASPKNYRGHFPNCGRKWGPNPGPWSERKWSSRRRNTQPPLKESWMRARCPAETPYWFHLWNKACPRKDMWRKKFCLPKLNSFCFGAFATENHINIGRSYWPAESLSFLNLWQYTKHSFSNKRICQQRKLRYHSEKFQSIKTLNNSILNRLKRSSPRHLNSPLESKNI